MRIPIPALTWSMERYPTLTLLNSIKSFTYFFRSRFCASRVYFLYTRVRSLFTSLCYLQTAAARRCSRRAAAGRASPIRPLIARPICTPICIAYAVNSWFLYIYIYGHLHAKACWKLATVVKADLNVQNCPKPSNFRYLGNGIQSARIVSTFSLLVPLLWQSRFSIFILPEDRIGSEIFNVVSPLYLNRKSRDLHQWIALVGLVSTRCYMPRYSLGQHMHINGIGRAGEPPPRKEAGSKSI